MNNKFKIIIKVATIFLAHSIYVSNALALTDDSTKPINIQADSAEINDATGISTYRGNVKITQGSTILTGDIVILETANKKVQKIISEGKLSTFKQTTDDGRKINAEAEKMVYSITGNKIVLTTNAKLTEAGNTFASDKITFYTDKEIVTAGSSTGNDRVNITVFPETIKEDTQQ
ncbi:MAG: lipopolysaccharide transport periplasmic protein LptA [Gammaproteobacteria bacterium]|nr:MAG: lipopolysaccharide transport periplasmic protein LptA [Gammaproteobacteria bacterium]